MMIDKNIYEVSRNEYKGFVEQIKPECKRVEIKKIDEEHTATEIFSVNTGKCLCSRITYSADYGEHEPEKYYVFEMPEKYERQASIPKQQLVLETKEEVQAFFDFLAKKNKKENNKNG
jgi:hypothetical protein